MEKNKETKRMVIDKDKDSAKVVKEVLRKVDLKKGAVILLSGDFGVGKTYFAKEIAKQLGFKDGVCSPSFTICREYCRKKIFSQKGIDKMVHYDLYRLKEGREVTELNIFGEWKQGCLMVIEWPNLMKESLKKLRDVLIVEIEIERRDNLEREFSIHYYEHL